MGFTKIWEVLCDSIIVKEWENLLFYARGNQVKTCIFHQSLNIHGEPSFMTEGQEFLGIKHSSESSLLSGNKQCTNPICEFNGLIVPCQWPNQYVLMALKAVLIQLPSYLLVPHIFCWTFDSGILIPGFRGAHVICLQSIQLVFKVITF